MERWAGKTALVTGASVGIGAAICRQLVQHGMLVIGCARNEAQLKKVAQELQALPGRMVPMKCDLEDSSQIEKMFADIEKQFGGVDVCVNNAGLNFGESLLEGSVAHWRTILNVNVLALIHCSQLAVRSMRKRNVQQGQIINICSVAGHTVFNFAPVHFYTASKHAVKALTEGLRQELAGSGSLQSASSNMIRVAQISPGPVQSEIMRRSVVGETTSQVEQAIQNFEQMAIDASQIGDAVVYILSAPQSVQMHDIILGPTSLAS